MWYVKIYYMFKNKIFSSFLVYFYVSSGRTPAKVALRAGHLHVCRLLEKWGAAPVHQPLQPEIGTNTSGKNITH